MPAKNKSQNIANISGSGSIDSPYAKNSISGIPDITFSDTALPVFAKLFQVNGTWNMPVSGFDMGDIIFSWNMATGFPGRINLTFTPNSNSSTIRIEFQPNSRGKVSIEVKENAAVSSVDNRSFGPPANRGFEVSFDTTVQSIGDINPAELLLNAPSTSSGWNQGVWNQKFTWTKRVNGFTIGDVDIRMLSGNGSFTLGELTPDEIDNRLYFLKITLTGSGMIEISVDANVATSGGVESPTRKVSTSWNFEATSVLDVPNITGNTGVEVILSETYDIGNNPERIDPTEGGLFMGVSDMYVYNSKVYFVDQIARKSAGKQEIDTLHPSAGALVSIHINNSPTTKPIIHKRYDYFTQAARSLVEHDGELHFFEGSAYHFGHEILLSTGAVIPVKDMGFLRKLNNFGQVVSLGLNYQSRFPTGSSDKYEGRHIGSFSPMISFDNELNIISQRKDFFAVNGVQWIVYSNKLNQKITLVETNGKTGFEVIERIAGLTNSIVGYETGDFIFKPRRQTQAYLSQDVGSTANSIQYKDTNRVISNTTGIIIVNDEIMSFNGIGTGVLNGITRGINNTNITTHSEDDAIVFIDKVIISDDMARPINDMDIETDGTLIYNHIIAKYAANQVPRTDFLILPAPDANSILENGERKIDLELPLDYHQTEWAKLLASQFLEQYKNLRFAITLVLKRDLEIRLGDIVYLNEPVIEDIQQIAQVMSVSHHKKREETEIIITSVSV